MDPNPYEYEPINLDELTFRIVRLRAGSGPDIEVDIVRAILDGKDGIPYEAVSYVWGSPIKPYKVYVDGKCLPVTDNLWHALYDLRSSTEDRWLWVDAICINQTDTKERNHQVQQMGGIYGQAERVLVYLGGMCDSTRFVMRCLSDLANNCYNDWPASEDEWRRRWDCTDITPYTRYRADSRLKHGMERLLRRPWFRRIWVLQEVANARVVWVYCGSQSIPARVFLAGTKLIKTQMSRHQEAVLDLLPKVHRYSETESKLGQVSDLFELLVKFKGAKAQDDRDRIFALLGMCAEGNGTLTADYDKDIQEVIRDTISFMCYCEPADVPKELCVNIKELMDNLPSLHANILERILQLRLDDRYITLVINQAHNFIITASILRNVAAMIGKSTSIYDISCQESMDSKTTAEMILEKIRPGEQSVTYYNKENVLIWAASQSYHNLIQRLKISGFDMEARDKNGLTPLLWAAAYGSISTFRTLHRAGADALAKDVSGNPSMSRALSAECFDVVEYLLHTIPDVSQFLDLLSLHFPTSKHLSEDPGEGLHDLSDRDGGSLDPLDLSSQQSQRRVEPQDNIIRIILAIADHRESPQTIEIAEQLLAKGANINSRDYVGRTPLMLAARMGNTMMVEKLLFRGADRQAIDDEGHDAKWFAMKSWNRQIELMFE